MLEVAAGEGRASEGRGTLPDRAALSGIGAGLRLKNDHWFLNLEL